MEFQLTELFAYPNTEISGAGQRGSDDRGWTVYMVDYSPLGDAFYLLLGKSFIWFIFLVPQLARESLQPIVVYVKIYLSTYWLILCHILHMLTCTHTHTHTHTHLNHIQMVLPF